MSKSVTVCIQSLTGTIETFHANKPNDRSTLDRLFAVTITMLEQALAYFAFWTE